MKYIFAYFNTLQVFFIFLGSVFLTSNRFIDTENSAKFYFVIIVGFVGIIISCAKSKDIELQLTKLKESSVLIGLYAVVVMQAGFGVLQYAGIFSSNHYAFPVTGSFENPAGFAAVLAMGFPIGGYLFSKAKNMERYFIVSGIVIIVMAIFFSGSRTGILAVVVSLFVFFLLQTDIIRKFKQYKFHKLLLIFIFCLLASGAFTLYHQKKDSADGRLLIWKVSSEMVKDKPVFGHGYGAFKAEYMDYQAEYFKNNPSSKYAQLADNVKHPFNEFIKITVEFGIVGLIAALSLFLFVLWKIIKSGNEDKKLVFSGLVSFLIFACFSYPLQYIAVWLLFALYLLALFPSKAIKFRNTPVSITVRSMIVVICVFSLFSLTKQMQAEIKWKTIAVNSLKGNTEKMLPEYEKLYSRSLKRNSFFLYNYGAELNIVKQYDKSIEILTECEKRFNDYDLQMLLADNYHKKGKTKKAIEIYQHASNMVPCRFLPLYHLTKLYQESGDYNLAVKIADEILNKPVKVQSATVHFIKREMRELIINKQLESTDQS